MALATDSGPAPKRKRRPSDLPEEDALNIYADGSMLPAPRRGGTGIIFILINEEGDEETDEPLIPGYVGATNQLMELQACIEALKIATGRRPPFEPHRYRKIIIFTDSTYVQNHYTTAMFTWSRNGWLTKSDAPIDNAEQWKELVGLLRKASNQRKRVDIRWVPGKKTARTKAVDKQAKKSAELASIRQLRPFQVRRKSSARELERGSVKMEGQRLTIRITKVEALPLQKLTKYWYEVLSKKSPFHDCRDVIYAEPSMIMKAGHHYFVRVNNDTGNPRIAKLYREVER